MTQTARNTPWWLRFNEQAHAFARQVIDSVNADLANMTGTAPANPGPARPSQDA